MTAESEDHGGQDRLAEVEDLRRQGAFERAMSLCQALIRERPDQPAPLLLAAAISRDTHEPMRALSFLDRAATLATGRPDIHCDRAQILRQSGDTAAAEAAYLDALAVDPCHVSAHVDLADLYHEAGRAEEAAYHLQVAIAIAPAQFAARERLAKLLDALGRRPQAAELRRETMRRAHEKVVEEYTRLRMPTAAAQTGMVQQARLSWSQALLAFGTSGVGLAKFQERQDDVAAAIQTYRETLRVLAEAADQAAALDGLRQTFRTVSRAFAQCHYEMALLLEVAGNLGGTAYHLEEALRTGVGSWASPRDKLGEIVHACGESIGTICELVAAYHGQALPPTPFPITRWNFARRAREWLVSVIRHRYGAEPDSSRRIAIFACTPEDIQISFAITCVLLAQGHAIDFLWMPCLHFDRDGDPTPRYDRWDERLMGREMADFGASNLPGGLRVIDLRDVAPAHANIFMEDAADRLALIDVCIAAGDRTLDTTKEPARTRAANRKAKDLDAMRRAAAYLRDSPIDHLILRDGGSMENGAVFHAARTVDIKVVQWAPQSVPGDDLVIAVNRSYGAFDVSGLWAADTPHRLTTSRQERVAAWLSARDGGDYGAIKPRLRHTPQGRVLALFEALRLDPAKPVVALFADRRWDSTAIGRDVAFPSHQAWIARTAAFFARHPEWQLVVRLHPADPDPVGDQIAAILGSEEGGLPENIRLMDARQAAAGYRLLDAAQLGLYYTGMIGLEMALLGVHAVSPARPFYGGLGFTDEATSEAAYFQSIQQALDNPEGAAMTDRQIELAWCFADLYVDRVPKRMPWSYRRFWQSITRDSPMEWVLGEEGRARYEPVFAVFGGDIEMPDGVIGALDPAPVGNATV